VHNRMYSASYRFPLLLLTLNVCTDVLKDDYTFLLRENDGKLKMNELEAISSGYINVFIEKESERERDEVQKQEIFLLLYLHKLRLKYVKFIVSDKK
jgi:hypothetical protein